MEVKIDARAGAVYVRLRKGRVHETRPLLAYQVIADLDEEGALLGVEVLDVPLRVDEFGYGHVDVAVTTSEGRVVEFDPAQLRDEEQPRTAGRTAKASRPRTGTQKPVGQARRK